MDDPREITGRACRDVREAASRIKTCAEELELPDLATLLAEADDAYRRLREAVDAVKDYARQEMEAAHVWRYEADSLPAPLKLSRTGTSPRWDGRQTARVVAARVADECVDPETGERLPLGVICERVADAIVDTAGLTPSKQWRKDSLRAAGIDLAGLVQEREGTPTVRWETEH